MGRLTRIVLLSGLMGGLPALAHPQATPVEHWMGSALSVVPVYLHNENGHWSASLTGDLKDPATELIEIAPQNGWTRIKTDPVPGGRRQCLTKMKDRSEFGYLECNSAFYSVNAGAAAAGALIRGVISLGILTLTDVASGNTAFTVTLDQAALDAAVGDANARELARQSAPLLGYRDRFTRARTPAELRSFIATFGDKFDPESLVAQAKEKLPAAVEREAAQARQEAAKAAQLAQLQQQETARWRAEQEAIGVFQGKLRPGDRVTAACTLIKGCRFSGMVIEIKPPLAQVQWENKLPPMEWKRVEELMPP